MSMRAYKLCLQTKEAIHLLFKPSVWEVNPITHKLALREHGLKEVEQKH